MYLKNNFLLINITERSNSYTYYFNHFFNTHDFGKISYKNRRRKCEICIVNKYIRVISLFEILKSVLKTLLNKPLQVLTTSTTLPTSPLNTSFVLNYKQKKFIFFILNYKQKRPTFIIFNYVFSKNYLFQRKIKCKVIFSIINYQ